MNDWPRRWRARWIWWYKQNAGTSLFSDPSVQRPNDAIGYLRRTYDLVEQPRAARCRVTADSRYILWVNGTLLGRGPVRSEPSHLTYDEYDIGPLLVPGQNAIAAVCRYYGGATLYWVPAQPVMQLGFGSFVLEAELETGEGTDLWITDSSWRVSAAPHLPGKREWGGPPSAEIIDGARVPKKWLDQEFDDSVWQPAEVLDPSGMVGVPHAEPPTEPFGLLGQSPLPQLHERIVVPKSIAGRSGADKTGGRPPLVVFESESPAGSKVEEPIHPVDAAQGETVTYDFGEIVFAHPILDIDAGAGTVIDLACGEDIDSSGRPVIAPRRWTLRYTAGGDGERHEAFDAVGFRYLSASVRTGEAWRIEVSGRERTFPRPPGAFFKCEDELLNDIWTAGARTLDLCSTDAYLDCPGREQRAWLGDAYVHTMISFVCNPNYDLAKWNLELHSQGARPDGLMPMVAVADLAHTWLNIPDYSLHWIRTLARAWDYLGDEELVQKLIITAARALEWFERQRGSEGLLDTLQNWVFIDWAQTERRGNIAAADALYALALDDFATLADATGNSGMADRARSRAAHTRESFDKYWDGEREVYVDAADPGGGAARRVSQQTNALAILAGMGDAQRLGHIGAYVFNPKRAVKTRTPGDPGNRSERLLQQWREPENFNEENDVVMAQPFFCHFVHQAMVQIGRFDFLMDSIRRWESLLAKGNGCFEEYWDAPPGLGSRCHAWSATPTFDLSTHVLGVRPASPGFEKVVIEPHKGGLEKVEGAVPTPRGLIQVKLGKEMSFTIPKGIEAELVTGNTRTPLRPGTPGVKEA